MAMSCPLADGRWSIDLVSISKWKRNKVVAAIAVESISLRITPRFALFPYRLRHGKSKRINVF